METLMNNLPKADLRVQGLKETLREARASNVQEIYLAKDCDADFIEKVERLNLPIRIVHSKVSLGVMLGLDVPCGVVAILKNHKN